jgi:ATP-dependent Clp protease adapter protein ClpS
MEAIQEENEAESTSPPSYTAMLWNDETHSFNEVIDIVCAAISCTEETAQQIATTVDAYVSSFYVRAAQYCQLPDQSKSC